MTLVWLLQTHFVNNTYNFRALFTAAYWHLAHQLQPLLTYSIQQSPS